MELEQKERSENFFESNGFDDFQDEIFSCPEERDQNRWAVSWSDLMMTMFIFFAVMYLYQVGDKEMEFGFGPAKSSLSEQGSGGVINVNTQSKSLDIFDQTRQAIKEVLIDDNISADLINDNVFRIVLAGDFLFDSGRGDLKLGARYQLDQIAKALNENEYYINVAGHTDDTPSDSVTYPTNWELSSHRAVMVARYLTEKCNVDGNRLYITAHSYHQPVKSNDTNYNRSLNRRVELILTKKEY
ncbi:MAG: OmpA family protein [Desulfobacterales bacterium]|nr:OmpA family protein [Desulfobacterales bacterium]